MCSGSFNSNKRTLVDTMLRAVIGESREKKSRLERFRKF
jgi:hypothetical protein